MAKAGLLKALRQKRYRDLDEQNRNLKKMMQIKGFSYGGCRFDLPDGSLNAPRKTDAGQTGYSTRAV